MIKDSEHEIVKKKYMKKYLIKQTTDIFIS